MSKRELDDLFRSKLSSHESETRPEAWERLSAQMNRKKGAVLWPYWSMGIAASLLIAFGIYFYTTPDNENNALTHIEKVPTDSISNREDVPVSTSIESETKDKMDSLPSKLEIPSPPVRKKSLPAPTHKLNKSYLAHYSGVDSKDTMNYNTEIEVENVEESNTLAVTDEKSPTDTIQSQIKITLALAPVAEQPDKIDTIASDTTEKIKPLKQMWQQLKALRKGEPVSLKEIRQTGQQLIAVAFEKDDQE